MARSFSMASRAVSRRFGNLPTDDHGRQRAQIGVGQPVGRELQIEVLGDRTLQRIDIGIEMPVFADGLRQRGGTDHLLEVGLSHGRGSRSCRVAVGRNRKLWLEFGEIGLPARGHRCWILEIVLVEFQHVASIRPVKSSDIGHPRTTWVFGAQSFWLWISTPLRTAHSARANQNTRCLAQNAGVACTYEFYT